MLLRLCSALNPAACYGLLKLLAGIVFCYSCIKPFEGAV